MKFNGYPRAMTTSADRLPKPDLSNPVQLLAFGFGSGCAPKAPGTVGTLMAVVLYLPLMQLSTFWYGVMLLLASVSGVWICDRASRQLGVHDHPGIVWDEFAGYWLTMWMAPDGWVWIIAGFALFRFFDIIKPWPIGWLDRRVGGGLGIMIDDILAGVFAWICLQSLHQFL